MPFSNLPSLTLFRFSSLYSLLFVLVLWGSVATSFAFAATCEVGNPLEGDWQPICTGVECSCGSGWAGASTTTNGSGSFEAINSEKKLVEGVTCNTLGIDYISCGWPGGDGYDACCAYYFNNKPDLEWPPCLTAAEDFINNGTSICNPAVCDAFPAPPLDPVGCGMCDNQGGMVNPRPTLYGWDKAFMKYVTSRTIYQWVCKSCTKDPITQENHYLQLIEKCGGAENIFNWDNETCTGECKGKNLGCSTQ